MTISFQQPTYTIQEGSLGNICVSLSGQIEREVIVSLRTSDGTAFASDNDYIAVEIVLTFSSAGADLSCTTISVSQDEVLEPSEMFSLALSSTDSAVLIPVSTASVTVPNDDGKLKLQSNYYSILIFFLFILQRQPLDSSRPHTLLMKKLS